jgi:C-terminal processing protease CtpA/Prc
MEKEPGGLRLRRPLLAAVALGMVAVSVPAVDAAPRADAGFAWRRQSLVTPAPKAVPPLSPQGGAAMRGGSVRLVPPSGATSTGAASAPDWCARIAAGPGGSSGNIPVDLSRAHATVREFGVDSAFAPADAALVSALESSAALTPSGIASTVAAYDAALPDTCARPADPRPLGAGRVDMAGRVAIVTPGTSLPPVPPSAQLVVLDLRDLPAVDNLDDVLAATVGPLLASPVDRPARWERGHFGPVDEVFAADNVYATFVSLDEQAPIAAAGRRDVPLVLLTGDRMPAAAVELAGALRMAGRAWIVGPDVASAVGEAAWRGVGGTGLAVRTGLLDRLFRRQPPQILRAQGARQDNPFDPTTSGYKRDVVIDQPDTQRLRVTVAGRPGADLDLYVLYDANGDGRFSFPNELIALSGTPTAQEEVDLLGQLPLGRYQIWVHGYYVPTQASRFDLTIDVASGQPWPDVIPADLASSGGSTSQIVADAQAVVRQAPAAVRGDVARSFPAPVSPYGQVRPGVTAKPELRAALVIAHGVARLFFPYFDVVGDGIDARLGETLATVEAWNGTDRRAAFDIIRRFGQVLHDGHQFLFNYGPPLSAGYIPVDVEEVAGGRPAVRRSGVADIHPGDVITAIGGRAIEDLYAQEFRLTSTATSGYRFDVASRFVLRINGPTVLTLADPGGTTTRQVTVQPVSAETFQALGAPGVTDRPSGPLGGLGAPDLYYLNMNGYTSPDTATVNAAIADATARGSRAMVLDMRGYPGSDAYEVAARLIRQPFSSPRFVQQLRLGPDVALPIEQQYYLPPLENPSFAGPIALLVGPHTVSAAENFSQMLVGSDRPAVVVGQRSAGTNGNITGVQLPGGFGFTYTGMRVLNVDGSQFHGIGIVPDITVPATAADLRDGVDRDLLAAVAALG